MLHNYTETAVFALLDSVLKHYKEKNPDLCTCERCRQDIIALALNNLPPHYIVTETGKIITQVSFDHFGGKAQVIAQLGRAVEMVRKDVRHEKW